MRTVDTTARLESSSPEVYKGLPQKAKLQLMMQSPGKPHLSTFLDIGNRIDNIQVLSHMKLQ